MKLWQQVICVTLLVFGSRAEAQAAPVAATQVPVTVEYDYRIKWRAAEEFKQLYDKNHAPLLEEMKKLEFIRSARVEEPFTHMAGGPRWDLRVTIVFRDATAAVSDPEWDRLWEDAETRL